MTREIINPWFGLVIGFDLLFLEKAKLKTLAYIQKLKEYPIGRQMNKRIKF